MGTRNSVGTADNTVNIASELLELLAWQTCHMFLYLSHVILFSLHVTYLGQMETDDACRTYPLQTR